MNNRFSKCPSPGKSEHAKDHHMVQNGTDSQFATTVNIICSGKCASKFS